jgi:hypothetical protein
LSRGPKAKRSSPSTLGRQRPRAQGFLGNEFLLWLWHEAEANGGEVGEVSILIDRSLDLDCAYGMTGEDRLRGTGPHRMPEARDALRTEKSPAKAGMVLDANGLQFSLTSTPKASPSARAKLPDVEGSRHPARRLRRAHRAASRTVQNPRCDVRELPPGPRQLRVGIESLGRATVDHANQQQTRRRGGVRNGVGALCHVAWAPRPCICGGQPLFGIHPLARRAAWAGRPCHDFSGIC